MPFQYICEHCGESFTRRGRSTPQTPNKFCSKSCARPVRPLIPQEDGTCLVPLTRGAFSIIDAEDAIKADGHHWHLHCGYAVRNHAEA